MANNKTRDYLSSASSKDILRAILLITTVTTCVFSDSMVWADSPTSAPKIIQPDQWAGYPAFSPDGTKVIVEYPPNKMCTELSLTDGIQHSQREVPKSTFILNARDFSVISSTGKTPHAEWSPDSKMLSHPVWEGLKCKPTLNIYNLQKGAHTHSFDAEIMTEAEWSPDSKHIAYKRNSQITIANVVDGSTLDLVPPAAGVSTITGRMHWSTDCKTLAMEVSVDQHDGTHKTFIIFWDAGTGMIKKHIELRKYQTWLSFGFSPDGKYFAYSEAGKLYLLDAATFKVVKAIETKSFEPSSFNWSPDRLKFGYGDSHTFHILNASSLQEISNLKLPLGAACRWSPDSRFLLVLTYDTAAICEVNTGRYLGYKKWSDMTRVQFFPDQKQILVLNTNTLNQFEPITLPPKPGASPFKNGEVGTPPTVNFSTPKTLNDCFLEFDTHLNLVERARFQLRSENSLGDFGGGSFITDSMMAKVYGNWDNSYIERYFRDRGVTDERDVTDIILLSYWRYLRHEPLKIEEQIKAHLKYWNAEASLDTDIRNLSPEIINCVFEDEHKRKTTLAKEVGKFKVVVFATAGSRETPSIIRSVQQFRQRNPAKDINCFVFLIPPGQLTEAHWPYGDTDAKSSMEISKLIALQKNSLNGGLTILPAPPALSQAVYANLAHNEFSTSALPITIVLAPSGKQILKLRLNQDNLHLYLEKAILKARKLPIAK